MTSWRSTGWWSASWCGAILPTNGSLWQESDSAAWQVALDFYPRVVEAQGIRNLVEHDRWFREELPPAIAARSPAYITLDELAGVVEWKHHRGAFRPRNLALARRNDPALVERTSAEAFAAAPDPVRPITLMARLQGIGPATASAVASAYRPDVYPFFDDVSARYVSGLGEVEYRLSYYRRFAEALRHKAAHLGKGWTAADVERALWAYAGGKAGVALAGTL